MKKLKNFYKNIIGIFVISMTVTLMISSIAMAATSEDNTKKELILQVEQLVAESKSIGVEITENEEGFNFLNEEELINIISLLNYSIECHNTAKEQELQHKINTNKISVNEVQVNSKDNLDTVINPMVVKGATTYDVREGTKDCSITKTVPYGGKTKQVTTSVLIYARWANKCVGNSYNEDVKESVYKVSQYCATKGSNISFGNIKSFKQNTIGIEKKTASGFKVVGTGTYKIDYKGVQIEFFVPFSTTFSRDDGTFQKFICI